MNLAGAKIEDYEARLFTRFGSIALLGYQSLRGLFARPFEFQETVRQMEYLGIRSLSISLLTSLFTGMVMALQFAVGLERFGTKEYVALIGALATVRELGPVLTSVVGGGRVGSGITAELGSMAVTEQIDAIRALGANPVKKLVVPRLLAMLIVLPMLTFMADIMGILGGLIVGTLQLGLPAVTYWSNVVHGIGLDDVFSGISKTFVFGIGITLIACEQGMSTTGGTEGVGQSTTRTVVASLIFVFMADFFLTKVLLIL